MFLNEGQKKDIYSNAQADQVNSPKDIKINEQGEQWFFIVEKSQKLVTAIYLISDFLRQEEPLKWNLREESLSFMSCVGSLKETALSSERNKVLRESVFLISKMITLLDITLQIRLISQMNYSILKKEYVQLWDILNSELSEEKPKDKLFFSKDFFNTTLQIKGQNIKDIHKRQNKVLNDLYKKDMSFIVSEDSKNNLNNEEKNIKSNVFNALNKKTTRQETILQLLRSKGEAGIKDIVDVIAGCSEKTIQRELLLLVQKGLVQRTGERRWSKYSLVSPPSP